MAMTTLLGWAATGIQIVGWSLMAHHRRRAMWLFLGNCVLWLAWSAATATWNIFALQLFYLAVNVRTIRAWRQEHTP